MKLLSAIIVYISKLQRLLKFPKVRSSWLTYFPDDFFCVSAFLFINTGPVNASLGKLLSLP